MPGAQRTVGPPSSRWDFHTWEQCSAAGEVQTFADREAAFYWLAQFRSEPDLMADLRSYAAASGSAGVSLWRAGDDQVLHHLAHQLSSGLLHAHRVPARATAWRVGEKEAAPAVTQAPVTRRAANTPAAAATPKPAAEPDTFSAQTDGAATAAVLRSAADSGVPFCEECAKAAAARKAA